jgi:hypothetical protein
LKGEKLEIKDISDAGANPLIAAALRRLSAEKAPQTVAQLVMWNLVGGLDWKQIGRLSRRWSNANELALAREFVARLHRENGEIKAFDESGQLFFEIVEPKETSQVALAADLRKALKGATVLGLVARSGIPARPSGPAVACRLSMVTVADNTEAVVQVSTTDGTGLAWISSGKFTLPLPKIEGATTAKAAESLADSMAEGILSRLVRVQLSKGPKVKGKDTFRIKIDNVSPLILNGLVLSGTQAESNARPSGLAGFSLPPRKSLTLPSSADVVERLGLRDGVKAIEADLSGL